jgi:two-component system, OmpR family, sensor kinase
VFNSIRGRLTIWYAGFLILILIVLTSTSQWIVARALIADIDNDVTKRAEVVVQVANSNRDTPLPEALRDTVDRLTIDEPGSVPLFIQIDTTRGQILARSRNLGGGQIPLDQVTIDKVLAGDTVWSQLGVGKELVEARIMTKVLVVNGVAVGIVQLAESLGAVNALTGYLRLVMFAEGGVAAVLAGIIGYRFVRGGLAPINEVIRLAKEIEAHDLRRRLHLPHSPTEVQNLVETFNGMLERLNAAFDSQRRFVADASHELRTPLTAMRGNIDVLLMDESLTQDQRQSLQQLSGESARLSRLVSNLLLLARSDAIEPPVLKRRQVDLDILMLEIYRQTRFIGDGVHIRLGHEDQISVLGDADELKQLFLNLADNAIKYTPKGGDVSLSLFREDGWAKVSVTDTGLGIPAEDLPHIFERFYRVDKSRSRDKGGTGLGLAIADWIAARHGGKITVESALGQGSTFTVWLPAEK